DGRYLAFVSDAALDPRDLDNGTSDVYLRDRAAGTTVLVSLSPNTVAGAISGSPSISGDGRWVAFSSLDEQIVAGDLNATTDVFLYDRDSEAVVLVSLNDAGDQANGPSNGASVSFDGSLVLFASSASNLVASPSSTTTQLYVRSLASNVAPSVDLPSTVDLAFSLTLDMSGTFTDPGSASGETYSATVDYGDGTGTRALALDGGTFGLFHTYAAAGSYTVTVVVTDSGGASGSATMVVNAGTHSYVWLEPVASSFVVGRNMPVKFRVLGPDGSLVFDSSVRVDVVDASGAVVAGPYFYGDQPSRSVTWNGDYYHVNVDTRGLGPDLYLLRVQFSSPTLTGEFTLATNGTAGSLRWSGLRQ
ncbi:MAG TPA: PKD domain-containing protein, partial [Candidatus Limnocylindria bacterium]|nr:PKD domain-containing protein [Candidatus Limnocylindria bacterium]